MSETEEKTKPATAKKLRKQREEGNVPQSQAMTSFFTTALGLLTLLIIGQFVLLQLEDIFAQIFLAVPQPLSETRGALFALTVNTVALAVAPIALATMAGAIIITVLFHKGIPFSVKPLTPKFEKLSPASGLKRVFGRRAWIENGVGLLRVVIWFGAAFIAIWTLRDALFRLDLCPASCTFQVSQMLIWRLVPVAIVVLLLSAGLDMLVQINAYLFEQKMSVSEHKREQKDVFGAPEIRQERNRLRKGSVRGAEHVGPELANMCFYSQEGAVGIRYHPEKSPLPRVSAVARSPQDATKLRAIIRDNGHPERNAPQITSLCLRTSLGAPVPETVFVELATAMREMFG